MTFTSTENHSNMASNDHGWETVKENAAPLLRGRKVETLEQFTISIGLRTKKERQQIDQMVQHFEDLVSLSLPLSSTSDSSNKDPLLHWLSYIKFHQETFPTATHDQFLLLERCFRTFYQSTKYRNDIRYIRIACMYADKTREPVTTFQEIYKLGIGKESATFWNAWAYEAEKHEQYQLAEQIFEKGIRQQAQPLPYLLMRQKRFQRRMSRHWLNSTTIPNEDETNEENNHHSTVLGTLSSSEPTWVRHRTNYVASSRNDSNSNHSATFTHRNHNTTTATENNAPSSSFAVYQDDGWNGGTNAFGEDESHATIRTDREREEERWKENLARAERWNERGSLVKTSVYGASAAGIYASSTQVQPPSAFCIHIDDDCAAQHQREEQQTIQYAQHQREVRDERTGMPWTGVETVTTTASKEKGTARPMWKNRLLTDYSIGDTGMEQCFEEARATAGYYLLTDTGANMNDFALTKGTAVEDDMSMSMEELLSVDEESFVSKNVYSNDNDDDDVKPSAVAQRQAFVPRPRTDELSVPILDPPLASLSFQRSNSVVNLFNNPTPRNASTASSTIDEVLIGAHHKEDPTINTQLALKELSMMFSSPAIGGMNNNNNNSFQAIDRSGALLSPILNGSAMKSELCNTTTEASDPHNTFRSIVDTSLVHCDGSNLDNSFAPHIATTPAKRLHGPTTASIATLETSMKVYNDINQEERATPLNGFEIFNDEIATTSNNTFTDDCKPPALARADITQSDANNNILNTKAKISHSIPQQACFTIFQDEISDLSKSLSTKPVVSHSVQTFDEVIVDQDSPVSAGNTACFSDIFGPKESEKSTTVMSAKRTHIENSFTSIDKVLSAEHDTGETVTISLINDIMRTVKTSTVKEQSKK